MAGRPGNPNIQNHGKRFEKGDKRINKNGRPRKWISDMKDSGYSLSEVTDAIQVLVSLEPAKLEEVRTNPNSTVLEITIASAIMNSINRGDLNSLETLLSRVYGKPKQQVDVDAKIDITSHVIKLKFGNTDGEENQGTQEESSES